MTTELPKPADRMSEVLGEIVAYCREAGNDWSNLSEAEALLAAGASTPTAQVVTDEREAFELWWKSEQMKTFPPEYDLSRLEGWGSAYKPKALAAWQAALAAQPEQAKGGEAVAQVEDWPDDRTPIGIVPLVDLKTLPIGAKLYTHPAPASPVAQQTAQVPEGWQLVPVELTDEMTVAFVEEWYSRIQTIDNPQMVEAYRAMLSASPSTAAPTEGGAA